ncbi:MAG: FGGY-family carbohydrate kinase [Candidatus Humimicrobiaceae bacterium]
MHKFLLGIDGGTECIKSGIYDTKGNLLGIDSFYYNTYHENTGWAEQKVEEWREGLIKSIKGAIKIAEIKPEDISGVGYDGTGCTVVFIDENNNPVRDPIIWMDVRSSEEAKFIESIDISPRKYNGWGSVSPEWFPCKNLWVKKNQPEIYKKSKIIAEYTDWLTHEITNAWTVGISTATIRGYYDSRNGGWPIEFYKKIGIGDIFEKIPKLVLKLGTPVGNGVSEDFAAKTGLLLGTPVGQGAVDSTSASIGANAFTSGRIFAALGSSNWIQINVDKEFHTKGLFGSYPDVVVDNFSIEGGQTSAGSVLKWFKTNFINNEIEKEAKKRKVSIYTYLDEKAADIPIGSEGLIVLEHWQGNRTPYTDPGSRGVIRGLSLKHTPFHVYRAIMEGIAYGTEASLRKIKENNFKIFEIIGVGGQMNSKLWIKIYADVIGLPIKKTKNLEATSLGSAIIGAIASKAYKDFIEAADNMVVFGDEVKPNIENHNKYKLYVDEYIKTYYSLKESQYNLNKL